jgi:prepilin-type N-terminal cleavage/methylation domain-containing protein
MNISNKKKLIPFTMIELVVVITIMAILLTISVKAMKTDSTSANASILGSSLSYAQTYAMSSLSNTQTLEVEVQEDKVIIKIHDTSPPTGVTSPILLKEEDFANGSRITTNLDTYTFDRNGQPGTTSGGNLTGKVPFTITDNKNPDNALTVTLRAFTGKVVYY